jgi:hypothetical protein
MCGGAPDREGFELVKDLFANLKESHAKITGWCSLEKAQTLAASVVIMRPAITVELGVWAGKSLIPMALAHQAIGYGQVIGVDPWSHDASVLGQVNPADEEWWSHQDRHEYAFTEFTRMVFELGLANVVKIERMTSDQFTPPAEIGILHSDGNHGEQSLRDINRFAPKVLVGGIVVLDDLQWTGGSVMASVTRLLELGFKELFVVNDPDTQNQWGVYQRIR